MQGYTDPANGSNMLQASHLDPQAGTMKTVSQFLTSPQPIVPIVDDYAPLPHTMVAGSPYPISPAQKATLWDRASAPGAMSLRALFNKPRGSTSV